MLERGRFQISMSVTEATLLVLMACLVVASFRPVPPALWHPWRANAPAITDFDPQLGTQVDVPNSDALGRPIDEGAKVLIYAGNCSSCSLNAWQPEKLRITSKAGHLDL